MRCRGGLPSPSSETWLYAIIPSDLQPGVKLQDAGHLESGFRKMSMDLVN